MKLTLRAATICGALYLVASGSGTAQAPPPPRASFGALSSLTFRGTETPTGKVRASGMLLGIEGRVGLNRAFLQMKYLQGPLSAGPGNVERDLVEGELLIGVHTTPWLALKAGLHIRSFATGGVVERWVLWEGRVAGEGELYAPRSETFSLHSYFEGWLVVSGNASVVDPFDRGLGAEAGLQVRLAGRPYHGRLAYRIDHGQLGSGARQETVEGLILGIGISVGR